MIQADRWAAAFVGACQQEPSGGGDDLAESGCQTLRALEPVIQGIPGMVSGAFAARELDQMLRASLARSDLAQDRGAEYACRLIYLMVQKGMTRHLGEVAQEIEQLLERRRGLILAVLESAAPVDGAFEEDLKAVLRKKTGATGIVLEVRLVPELLGGCRVRVGSESWDASIRGMLQTMARDLDARSLTGGVTW